MEVCPKRVCISTVGRRTDLFARDPYTVPITDFFGSVRKVDLSSTIVNVTKNTNEIENINEENDRKGNNNNEKFEYPDLFPIDTVLKQVSSSSKRS